MSAGPPPLPGNLSDEIAEPVLEFRVGRNLDYRSRMRWTLGLAACGLMLQVAFLSVWPGLPFLLAAVALSWVVGFDTALDRRGFHPDAEWEPAPPSRLREILAQDRRTSDWDSSALDVTSGGGACLFVVLLVALGLGSFVLAGMGLASLGLILAVDGALLVLSQWFSGMRRVHRQPDLVLKARHLDEALGRVRGRLESAGELACQLRMVGKPEERHPTDVRLSLRFPQGPEGFHGLQTQVVLNRVQGKPYPYGYSVVVAKRGLGLLKLAEGHAPPMGLIKETKSEGEVDVVVIRQKTTKTSGYHTEPSTTAESMRSALELAERFLSARGV